MQFGKKVKYGFLAGIVLASVTAWAAGLTVNNTTLNMVAVNGGSDTANPGVSCIAVAGPVSAKCVGTYMYIPNNNKHLVAAALSARASNSKVTVYYEDAAPAGHCPGLVFTPCSVISIMQQAN